MPKLSLVKGATSQLVEVFIQDSSSPAGAGLTGLVFNTASLTAYYYRSGAASAVAITLVTMTLGTWTSGGFVVVDGTNMPGAYQLALPDAALAAGADKVTVFLKGATNMAMLPLEIQLTSTNPNDSVRFGMTALPNAAAGATGGLDGTVVFGGTASAGAATTLTLAGASATDNIYNHMHVRILSGTGAGQERSIVAYNGTTKVATVGRNWTTTPDNTSVFVVVPPETMPSWNLFQGVASAGGATSVTLTGGSATSSIYNGALVVIMAGTGARQARVCTAYNGGTGVLTVDRAWQTNPDATSVIVILAGDYPGADGAGNLSGSVASVVAGVTVTTNNDKTGYGLASNAVDAAQFTQAAADKVWTSATRTLSAFSLTLAQSVWDVLAASVAAANSIGLQLKTNVDAAITSRLAPTTAGRTLDVAATGEAGLDFDNIKDAAGAHTLTNIRVPNVTLTDTVTTYTGDTPQTGDAFARLGAPAGATVSADIAGVQADTDNVQTRLPAALVGGRIDANVGAYTAGQAPLQPTVAGRTLDVAATGEAGLDFDNIKDASGAHTLTNIRVPNVTLADTVTTYTGNTPQTGDNFARLGAPVGASISADVAGVQADTDNIQTRLPAALVGGRINADAVAISGSTTAADAVETNIANLDAAVSSRSAHSAADVWAAATRTLTAFGFTPAASLSAGERNSIADALLDRDMATGTDSGSPTVRTVRQALRALRNKFSLSGTTRTVFKEDDLAASWTSTLSTNASADPVVGDDPA